ncbi:protein PHYTOCHROME KINASE SUBSTRATE 3-like [Andrographis paniculata]|uniref:protein PHYTOCHROME KINASE SUBSTRATE 3-like n=1 Tax=Andrographis paniculata TaxID=175694 RepID=UPI0021E89C68|nr:protein PHYTOCHROME KINASE SUBSTRATE 3-like [Andrographis paniculata]
MDISAAAADDGAAAGLRVASFACYLDADKDTLLHKISPQDTAAKIHKSAAAAAAANNNLRIDSLSYNLKPPEDHGFVFNVPKPIQNRSGGAFAFPKDTEISVFGADKYFNAVKLDHRRRSENPMKEFAHVDNCNNNNNIPARPPPPPPSMCSEVSSLNSRTALMAPARRSAPAPARTASRRSCFFTRFACQGPCFDRKDVVSVADAPPAGGGAEESRNSIEVFGAGVFKQKGDVAANLERKLSMLTWDAIPAGSLGGAIPAAAAPPPASTARTSTICDDMASDASSDLFEIENITGSMYPMLTAAAAAVGDDVSCCQSPASQYAPSEASIQWSVVTASAADYSSVLSDYHHDGSVSCHVSRNNSRSCTKIRNGGAAAAAGKKSGPKGRAGGLLGCKNHKAVDVAENACAL